MANQMSYELFCLEIVLEYLPLASPELSQKMEKSWKIEIEKKLKLHGHLKTLLCQ